MLADYVDFITASPEVLNMAGFVLVLAPLQGLHFVIIKIKIGLYEADKRNRSLQIGYLKK